MFDHNKLLYELSIDGKKVDDGDDASKFNMNDDETGNEPNSDANSSENNDDNDDTDTNFSMDGNNSDGESETGNEPNSDNSEQDTDYSMNTNDDNSDGESETGNETEDSDTNNDGNDDEIDTNFSMADENSDNSEDADETNTDPDTDNNSDNIDIESLSQQLSKLEKQLFADLSPDQESIRQAELRNKFISIITDLNEYAELFSKLPKIDITSHTIDDTLELIIKMKRILTDYVSSTFDTCSMSENEIMYKKVQVYCKSIHNIITELELEVKNNMCKDSKKNKK